MTLPVLDPTVNVAIERIAACMARFTMPMPRVLITSGARFIASHLADELLRVVYHLAARPGVAQSMYEVAEYSSVNSFETPTLLEALIGNPIQKLIVAASWGIHGEGLDRDHQAHTYEHLQRTPEQLVRGDWEPYHG